MSESIRIACAVPPVRVGDVKKNADDICAYMEKAAGESADFVIFPELSLTGSTCGDLFRQEILIASAEEGLEKIVAFSGSFPKMTAVVGLPMLRDGKLYNCAAIVRGGKLADIVAKKNVPVEQLRWFDSDAVGAKTISENGICVAIGEDGCVDAPCLLHLGAAMELVGSRDYSRSLAMRNAVYAGVNAGCTESTSNGVFSGRSIIAQGGKILRENEKFIDSDYMLVCQCDLNAAFEPVAQQPMEKPLRKHPFIPSDKQQRKQRCMDVFAIQVAGLKQRLQTINANAVIGISGGLDSTLALLVAVEAMRQLGRPMTDVYGVTMPCFGTSDRTYQNSWELMKKLGICAKEINIRNAVTQHFADIGHDASIHNATYENSQARERTQILMDYASVVGGIVVGTGDLSELALGWCTYNGDHMSMYGVNATVPKTLIRWIIETVAEMPAFAPAKAVLDDILNTPISPELLPPDASGKIAQQTEDLVGPYALHDFFLYHMLRHGRTPAKIYELACSAFAGDFDGDTIKKWLKNFYRRFFAQQFKRNCMPDGVRVGSVSLGPRGDWNMPSDASGRIWLEEVDKL